MKALIVLFVFMSMPFLFSGQGLPGQAGLLKDIDPNYKGWLGNPDSVTVRIMPGPPEFSSGDSTAIRDAITAWNNTNSRPKFKLITSGTPQISITRNDNMPGSSGSTTPVPDWEQPTGMAIEIDTDDGEPVFGIALHELGHTLGLDDTTNEEDVMEGHIPVPPHFSKHDSDEITSSVAAIQVSHGIQDAVYPSEAFMPGQFGELWFPLEGIVPDSLLPGAQCTVTPVGQGIYTEGCMIDPAMGMLYANVLVSPDYPDGQFFLMTTIMTPGQRDLVTFLGKHYVNQAPVGAVIFECPMEISVNDGLTYIKWQEGCTYPFGDKLRSRLTIDDGTEIQSVRQFPDGDYIFDLPAGSYTFTLYVDDFQGNTAMSVQSFVVTGIPDPVVSQQINVGPNPFQDQCTISFPSECGFRIMDLCCRVITSGTGRQFTWKPSNDLPRGIYLIQAEGKGWKGQCKVIYTE